MSISDRIYSFYHSNWQTNAGYVVVDVVLMTVMMMVMVM